MQEKEILEKFNKTMNWDQGERKSIHVSALVYDCLRRGYYDLKHGQSFDLSTLMTFWIGRKLHETPILKENEIALEYMGVKGSCDEYEDGTLVEKKTCKMLPRSPNDHHKRQVEYYAMMLGEQGKPVKEACSLDLDRLW